MRLFESFFLLIILFPLSTNATDHYVDKDAIGRNNGTSWTNAWESFSAINWRSVNPGDVIFISGGTDSTVYFENLNVRDNGTAADPILIRNSYEEGHNGRVIIDGEFSRTGLITSSAGAGKSSSYIQIKGIEVRNSSSRGPAIQIHYDSNVITLDSLIVYNNLQRAIRIAGSSLTSNYADSITIKNCYISTPLDEPYQTDGIYAQDCANTTIENSFIWARNLSLVNNHSDGLQAHRTRGWKISNSVFVCDSNAQGMAIILGAGSKTANSDSVILYNNIIINRGIWWTGNPPDVASFNTRWYSDVNGANYMPPTFLYHNTIISYGPDAEGVRIFYTITEAKNNIIAQYGSGKNPGGDGYKYTIGASYDQPIKHFGINLFYREWSRNIGISGKNWIPALVGGKRSIDGWSGWKAAGGSGINGNPDFQHNWYGMSPTLYTGEIGPNSAGLNKGEDLQSLIEGLGFEWKGINGVSRDSTPDIGAYQY